MMFCRYVAERTHSAARSAVVKTSVRARVMIFVDCSCLPPRADAADFDAARLCATTLSSPPRAAVFAARSVLCLWIARRQ